MEQAAETIDRLVKIAARLRKVRRAQRRFLRLWAEQRVDVWTNLLRADVDDSSPLRIALADRLRRLGQ